MSSEPRTVLGRSSVFSGLDPRQLDALATLAVRARYQPRQVVLRKGDPALQIYVILAGRLKAITAG
ncbi:MAG: cyclic nucleotide-binding domain-containing protein, partial [Gemmatimonadota bacterium]